METRAFKLSGYMIILASTFNFVCFSDMWTFIFVKRHIHVNTTYHNSTSDNALYVWYYRVVVTTTKSEVHVHLHEKSVLWICHHDGSVTNHSTDAEHLILRRDQKLMLFVNIIQPCIMLHEWKVVNLSQHLFRISPVDGWDTLQHSNSPTHHNLQALLG